MRKTVIGVMGAGSCDARTAALAYEVGQRIAERGAVLLCGGGGGVMTAAAEGAQDAGGLTVGVLPGKSEVESPPNAHISLSTLR